MENSKLKKQLQRLEDQLISAQSSPVRKTIQAVSVQDRYLHPAHLIHVAGIFPDSISLFLSALAC